MSNLTNSKRMNIGNRNVTDKAAIERRIHEILKQEKESQTKQNPGEENEDNNGNNGS